MNNSREPKLYKCKCGHTIVSRKNNGTKVQCKHCGLKIKYENHI